MPLVSLGGFKEWTDSLNPKPDVLESNPCFPEPHGGKCGGQADISLSGVAESHGFKKGVQRFSLIAFLFWFVLDKILEKLGGQGAILRPHYDPPFKCRVPKLNFMYARPYSPKGYSEKKKINKSPTKFQQILIKVLIVACNAQFC